MSSTALNYLINLLSRRDYSEYEVRCKLQQKSFSEADIEQAIQYCQQKNWQNDLRFTENYLRYRAQKGFGINRIKQELKQLKGVHIDIIEQACNQSEIDWQQLALQVLHKKFTQEQRNKSPQLKAKAYRYMVSHGFYAEDFSDNW